MVVFLIYYQNNILNIHIYKSLKIAGIINHEIIFCRVYFSYLGFYKTKKEKDRRLYVIFRGINAVYMWFEVNMV